VIKTANLNIREKAIEVPKLKGMGTTMTLAFARRSELNIVHVGDSRAYQVDGYDGEIRQLTSDHSFVQALVDSGHITAEEAEHHPMRNVLYRALGQDQNVDVDSYTDLRLNIGDSLVLCSDGLTLHVAPHEIASAVMEDKDPDKATEKLLALANSRGGKDNISVIVIRVEGTQEDTKSVSNEDDLTVPIAPIFYKDTDTVEMDRPNNITDSAPIYNSAYGEGDDPNEPSQ
jgi:serine/threonine protein phosphatase PrpC